MIYLKSVRSALVLAAATLALAAPAGAKEVDSWEVNGGAKSCTMISTFEDDVSIGLLSSKGGLAFMAGGEGLAKLVHSGQKVSLGLKFAGGAPHNEWTDEGAQVVKAYDSVAIVGDWGPSLSKELADTVLASKTVTVSIGGKVVGTYDLSGSPVAYRELSQCGSQLAAQ
jgi:hypothetical protein